jgi:hypothetical protein
VVSPRTPVSTINNTHRHDIAEIVLKVALNTINHHHNNIITLLISWVVVKTAFLFACV